MLGWSISISILTPAQMDAAKSKGWDWANHLAHLEVKGDAIGWMRDLVAQGKAREIPTYILDFRFVAEARFILPVLKAGLPDAYLWRRQKVVGDDGVKTVRLVGQEISINDEALQRCAPDQELTIEVADLS